MNGKEIHAYLQDMLKTLGDILDFTRHGRETFEQDLMIQYAVVRAYEIIGEIAKRIPKAERDLHPQIQWDQLIRFRDYIAHNYDTIRLENLWQAVEDVPNLIAQVQVVQASITPDT